MVISLRSMIINTENNYYDRKRGAELFNLVFNNKNLTNTDKFYDMIFHKAVDFFLTKICGEDENFYDKVKSYLEGYFDDDIYYKVFLEKVSEWFSGYDSILTEKEQKIYRLYELGRGSQQSERWNVIKSIFSENIMLDKVRHVLFIYEILLTFSNLVYKFNKRATNKEINYFLIYWMCLDIASNLVNETIDYDFDKISDYVRESEEFLCQI